MATKSYMDENTGTMILRCKKYPQKGSKEWIVSGDTIELRVMEKEGKNRTFSISDMTKARLRIYPSANIGHLYFTFKVDSGTMTISPLTYEFADSDDVARKIYNYIAERNPNIPPLAPTVSMEPGLAQEAEPSQSCADETAEESVVFPIDNKRYPYKKAPGRMLLRVIGIIYIAIGGFLAVGLLRNTELASITMIVQAAARLYIGIFAVVKCNDLTKSDTLQALAVFNLFLIIAWRRDHILLIVIIAALSVLFLVGAVKNCRAYQRLLQQGISVEKPKGNSKEPIPAKPLGKILLRIAGVLQSIFAVIAIGDRLRSSIITAIEFGPGLVTWIGLLVIFLPLCLGLFSGIFGVVKSNDLTKSRTLRTLAITTIILVGVLSALGARFLPAPALIIGFALPILFLVGAQINYMEYKRLHQQQ